MRKSLVGLFKKRRSFDIIAARHPFPTGDVRFMTAVESSV
jgi:hypothetical protein